MSRDRIKKLPILDLSFLAALISIMAAFMFHDPFRINFRIIDFLRLNFPLFTKEPKLLFYASMHIGSLVAKSIAIAAIIIFTLIEREYLDENLALKMPKNSSWKGYLGPFILFAIMTRFYYSANPLVPNLPIRLVFPEAMIIGNLITIPSVLFIAPVAEEAIFRGYIFDVLKRAFGVTASILATSTLFAIAHFSVFNPDITWLAIIFVNGLVWAILREKTGSILIPILFHFIYNLTSISIGIFNFFILGY